jgi:hypothetical protein
MDGLFTDLQCAGHVLGAEAMLVHPLAEEVVRILMSGVPLVVVPHGQDFTESVKLLKQYYCQITETGTIFRRQ